MISGCRLRHRAFFAGRLMVLALLLCGLSGAQTPEASHQLRFATPRERLQRAEHGADLLLRTHPGDAAALGDRGLARLRLGKNDAAINDLRRATALNPRSSDIQANLAYALWTLGRTPEALDSAQRSLVLNPNNISAHATLGRILLYNQEKAAEAVPHLQRALDLDPEESDLRFDLFNAFRQTHDLGAAGMQIKLLKLLSPPQDPRVLYAEGLLLAEAGNPDAAARRYQQALAANPSFVPARQDLGVAFTQLGRWPEAVAVLAPLTQQQPTSYPVAYLYALALHNAHQDHAEAEAMRALALAPRSAEAHTLVGIIQSSRGDHTHAVVSLRRAIQLDPKNFDAQFYLGRDLYALSEMAAASQAFQSAVALRPEDPQPRFFLATALEAAGLKDDAISQYRNLVQRRPDDPRGYIGLGVILSKYGQDQEALRMLQRAHELEPHGYESSLALGRMLLKNGAEESIGLLRDAVSLQPDSPEAHYQLGLGLKRFGKSIEADREFATVQRLNQAHRSPEAPVGTLSPPPVP